MPTLTIQPDGAAGLDTFLESANPTVNKDGSGALWVGELNDRAYTERTLIKFDLSPLPDSAIISSAVLSLWAQYDKSSNARTFRVYRQKRAWVEDEATWNIYKTGSNWSTAGGFHADDCEQADIGSRAFTATEGLEEWKHFSLTPTTKAGLDLGNGWMIKADTENNDAYAFYSSDYETAAHRPKLVVDYTIPKHSFGVIF